MAKINKPQSRFLIYLVGEEERQLAGQAETQESVENFIKGFEFAMELTGQDTGSDFQVIDQSNREDVSYMVVPSKSGFDWEQING